MTRATLMIVGLALGVLLWSLPGCEGDNPMNSAGDNGNGNGNGQSGADGDTDTDGDNDADADGDNDADGDGDASDICDQQDFNIEFKPARIMILLDNSSSMTETLSGGQTKQAQAKQAVITLVSDPANQDKWFGLDIFPDQGNCGTSLAPPVTIALNNNQKIVDYVTNTYSPNGSTPLWGALNYYNNQAHATASGLYDPTVNGYIIVVTDGTDTCFNGLNVTLQITNVVKALVSQYNIKSFAIGFGSGVTASELNAIAKNGGTPITSYLQANNQQQLLDAFAKVAKEAVSCRFQIAASDKDIDPNKVNFYFDGTVVPQDPNNKEGWNWVDSQKTTVEFYGKYCEELQAGTVKKVSATFGCPTVVVN